MKIDIHHPAELGLLARAVRRNSKVRIDDLAATAGLSKQFVSDVERGKPTVQLGRVLKLLQELGVSVSLDIPQEALAEFHKLQAKANANAASHA
jgi:transcriptional regulator with XRE-family HTH domain